MSRLVDQGIHTGLSVEILIKGNKVGRAQSVSIDQDFGAEQSRQIGDYLSVETVYTQYEGTATVTRSLLRRGSLEQLGLQPLGAKVLETVPMDLVVMDKITKDVVYALVHCSASSSSFEVTTNAISSAESQFVFLDMKSSAS